MISLRHRANTPDVAASSFSSSSFQPSLPSTRPSFHTSREHTLSAVVVASITICVQTVTPPDHAGEMKQCKLNTPHHPPFISPHNSREQIFDAGVVSGITACNSDSPKPLQRSERGSVPYASPSLTVDQSQLSDQLKTCLVTLQ